MKKTTSLFIAFILVCGIRLVQAKQLDDLDFPDTVTLPRTDTQLQLNGVGYRTKFIFKIYAGALYTEKKVKSRDAVQALKGPKRVVMHFVYSEVDREKLVAAWNEGFEENTAEDQLKALSSRIRQFNDMFTTMKEGDVVLLDYIPGEGTQVIINGKVKGVVKGEDFNAALLDIWLGDEPADDDLKEAMLGEEEDEDD